MPAYEAEHFHDGDNGGACDDVVRVRCVSAKCTCCYYNSCDRDHGPAGRSSLSLFWKMHEIYRLAHC